MQFQVTILGSNSALPSYGRHPTAQIVGHDHQQFLVDCGEGTQMQIQRYRIRWHRLDHIFISHLHGDHYFGLIGLITSLSLNGRRNPLHLFGPAGLMKILDVQFEQSETRLNFPLEFCAVDAESPGCIFENDKIAVDALPLDHRIPCTGFLFREKPKPLNILPEKIAEYSIPLDAIAAIKAGADYAAGDGREIANRELTREPAPPRRYAFASDTAYSEALLPLIQGVDLLYHEATFGSELAARARETHHSTAAQAAALASKAGVQRLLIGHFSSRYKELNGLLEEAQAVFPKTDLALEGKTYEL